VVVVVCAALAMFAPPDHACASFTNPPLAAARTQTAPTADFIEIIFNKDEDDDDALLVVAAAVVFFFLLLL
jgi:hypothetical protein